MKLRLFAALCSMVLGVLPAAAAEPFRYALDIEAPAEIKSLLLQYLDVVRLRASERMSAEQLSRLVDATPDEATRLLETEGYFAPQITLTYRQDKAMPHVLLTVVPGKPVRVGKVQFVVSGAIADNQPLREQVQAQILAAWTLPQGDIFKQKEWDEVKKRSLSLLQEKGYAAASIASSEARIDPAAQSAELQLELDSGAAYRFGSLNINGLKHYPESLVRDQATFVPGDSYRRSDLVDMQNRLHDLPHFSLVVMDPELSPEPPYEASVRIDVQEAPRHKVTTGLGYSTNTGIKSELGYRFLNLANRGWISESKLRLEQFEQAAETSVTLPRLGAGYEHRASMGYLRSDVQNLLSHTWRAGISRQHEDFHLTRIWSLEYLAEQRELEDGTQENPRSLALKFQWLRRDVDDIRNPRRGNLLQLVAGGAHEKLLSDASFLHLYGRGVRYWPMGPQGVLIARAEMGQTFANEEADVPSDWLFRAGGAGSVRGYDYQSLGVESGGSIVPGRVLATASIEYQIPVYKDWRAAVFVDHGSAAGRWADWHGKTGAGVGARWVSPVGVLGLDLARAIEDRKWRLHVALGLAF
ncbi:MAG: hypothetical protein H6R07_691 [Proteobacteria bacterium]|nr:hypothetical protein [Pseudomonadota bacterium]